MRESLTRAERLKTKSDFKRAFSSSHRQGVPGLTLFIAENGLQWNRIAITLKRKYGNSVQRNRVKRILREVFRKNKSRLKLGYDVVLLVYPGNDRYEERENQLLFLLKKAGIVR